jgi:hypothetical protein
VGRGGDCGFCTPLRLTGLGILESLEIPFENSG